MINLKIDPEFQNQIPPLTDDEYKQLEENILKEGKLLSPLIVWGNTLVDGHNRYAILQKHRHHGKEDGAEDRLLGPVRFPRTVLFGRLHGTSPFSCRFLVVTLSRRTSPVQCRCPHTRHQSIRR